MNGKQTDLSKAVFVHELTPGEGAENGIAASKEGAVILTNQNCYLLRAITVSRLSGAHRMRASARR